MARAARAAIVLLRASLLGSLQYRADFFFSTMRSLFEVAWTLVPLLVVFGQRSTIAGWSLDEALLVTACFTALKALLEGLITPSLVATIEQIRRGSFDFVLLKPIDSQLLTAFAKLEVFSASELVAAIGIAGVALSRMHLVPSPAQLGLAALSFACAVVILYALNTIALSVAFYVARIDNLAYLLGALFDAARWPVSVFSGALRLVFTFVLPLGVMTTFPPLALLGRLDLPSLSIGFALALGSLALARLAWLRGLAAYRSAGG